MSDRPSGSKEPESEPGLRLPGKAIAQPGGKAAAPAAADASLSGQFEVWLYDQVLQGEISPQDAADRLDVSVATILRATRHRQREQTDTPETAPLDEATIERLSDNWQRAQEGAPKPVEELAPLDMAIQSVAPARWLFGTERRRIALAIAACALLGIGIFVTSMVNKQSDETGSPSSTTSAPIPLPDRDDYERAKQIAQQFLSAPTWEEKAEFVRRKDSVRALMRTWYDERKKPLLVLSDAEFVEAKGTIIGDTPFVVLEAKPIDGQPIVLAVDLSSTSPAIDWESHVHYQPMSWEQFKRERPTEPLAFRVRIEPSNYYAPPFEDQSRWGVVRLTAPYGIVGLEGYVEKESTTGVEIANILRFRGKSNCNLIVALQFPESSTHPTVEIKAVHQGWIVE